MISQEKNVLHENLAHVLTDPITQWDTARQISLIFVRDISESVGCVIIRFLRYYRLTDGMGWGG